VDNGNNLIELASWGVFAIYGVFAFGMRTPTELWTVVDIGSIEQDAVSA